MGTPNTRLIGISFSAYLLLQGANTQAAEPVDTHTDTDAASAASCVEVEVNGVRSQSYACLTERLKPKAAARAAQTGGELASEQIANRPSNQLGLFNRAATSNRMGNTFGTSVFPQRPPESAR